MHDDAGDQVCEDEEWSGSCGERIVLFVCVCMFTVSISSEASGKLLGRQGFNEVSLYIWAVTNISIYTYIYLDSQQKHKE